MAALVDQFGNPIDFSRLREEEAGPTLTGVRSILSDHPAQGLTPRKLAALLRDAENGDATRYLELAEEMEEKDLHYRSVLPTRKLQVASLPITVEAASDSAEDVADADLIRGWLKRDTLKLELFDILDAVGKGFSVTEIIWNTTGGQWLPVRLEWRDPRWFEFDRRDGRTPLLRTETGPQPLAPYKYIQHVHQTKSGLPIRGGLARAVAWGYLFKNFDIKAWVEFLEVYGHPLRLGKFGPGASEKDKATLLSAVRNIARDAAAIIPTGMEIAFIEAKLSGNIELFEKFATWIDNQVSKAVLGQTGTTDAGPHVGTADAHQGTKSDIEEYDASQLAATLNRDLVRPIIDLNRGPRKAYPRLIIERPDAEDLNKFVLNVGELVDRGMEVEQSVVRDRLGIPDPAKGAKLLVPKGSAPPSPPIQPAETAAHAQIAASTPAPDAIDQLAIEELAEWERLIDPLIEPIRKLLSECATYEEFLRRLPEVIRAQDVSLLADSLLKCMFAARLAGETEADLGGA